MFLRRINKNQLAEAEKICSEPDNRDDKDFCYIGLKAYMYKIDYLDPSKADAANLLLVLSRSSQSTRANVGVNAPLYVEFIQAIIKRDFNKADTVLLKSGKKYYTAYSGAIYGLYSRE